MGLFPLIGRKETLIMISLACLGYALLTGFQVPVIRAFIMVELAFLAQMFGREGDSIWILALTGGIMLIVNPSWLVSISFQLPFLATLGVLVFPPLITNKLSWVPEIIRQDLGVSISAQALTWPIIAYNFNQVSLIGLLANVLVLWTVPFIMLAGAVILGLSFISLWLAQV